MDDNGRRPDTVTLKALPIGEVPDLYANSVNVSTSHYDVLIRLFLQEPDVEDYGLATSAVVGQVRLSHGQAWLMAQLILRHLSNFVANGGAFHVAPEALERLDMTAVYEEIRKGMAR